MVTTETTQPKATEQVSRADAILQDHDITSFLSKFGSGSQRTRNAVEWLLNEYPTATNDDIAATVRSLLKPLRDKSLTVFFSYKATDRLMAERIASYLEEWSAGKLKMEHMARFGVEHVGRDWRRKIVQTIPLCDWFLLLMPSHGTDSDWPLFEAGYFQRGQRLAGRLVCLHHASSDVVDALGAKQSVPAEKQKVVGFLQGLFHLPNWIPGMPALNPKLSDLESKAESIVKLFQMPSGVIPKICCAPHMALMFENPRAVEDWRQISDAQVIDANESCRHLFGREISQKYLRDWFEYDEDSEERQSWAQQIARCVQAAARGEHIPRISQPLSLRTGNTVNTTVCAVRRDQNRKLNAVDLIFTETAPPCHKSHLDPKLHDLAMTVSFAVRFRWNVLKKFSGRKIERQDVLAFNKEMYSLYREALQFFQGRDPEILRSNVLSLFDGEEEALIKNMFERWDELQPQDTASGELDEIIGQLDYAGLARIIDELLEINRDFLMVATRRMAGSMPAPVQATG